MKEHEEKPPKIATEPDSGSGGMPPRPTSVGERMKNHEDLLLKEFSYAVLLITSTLLLLLGQFSVLRDYSHPLLALSSMLSLCIAAVFANRSRLPELLTALLAILVWFLGPIVWLLIYACFSTNKTHTGNILIVVVFLLLRHLLSKPTTKLGLKLND
ncbi:MAG: hypothetical protein K2Z81_23155 [Cyanobacteria bacterium]|nr:hypothetical protein [Cyanobacteriota bacterium]